MPKASTGASGPPELTVSGWRGLVRERPQEGSGPRWGELGSKQPRSRACEAGAPLPRPQRGHEVPACITSTPNKLLKDGPRTLATAAETLGPLTAADVTGAHGQQHHRHAEPRVPHRYPHPEFAFCVQLKRDTLAFGILY